MVRSFYILGLTLGWTLLIACSMSSGGVSLTKSMLFSASL